MKYFLHKVILTNCLPEVIPAVEYSPAIPATETEPEIPEVPAQPEKYKFFATILVSIEGAPEGKFIQTEYIEFVTKSTEQTVVRAALQTEAQNHIDINYPEI